jgi:hypothetical protein
MATIGYTATSIQKLEPMVSTLDVDLARFQHDSQLQAWQETEPEAPASARQGPRQVAEARQGKASRLASWFVNRAVWIAVALCAGMCLHELPGFLTSAEAAPVVDDVRTMRLP